MLRNSPCILMTYTIVLFSLGPYCTTLFANCGNSAWFSTPQYRVMFVIRESNLYVLFIRHSSQSPLNIEDIENEEYG
jgi:hypothetical protein